MKRLRSLSPATSQSPQPSQKHAKVTTSPYLLSVLSWNVDNPSPYLNGTGRSSSSSKPITSYLKRTNHGSKARGSNTTASDPSLYDIFAAHGFPAVCCLQEVKCLAKDREGIKALRISATPLEQRSDSSSEEEEETVKKESQVTYTAHFSLCKSNFGAKRFGVGTYVSSRFPYQYSTREVDWDAEGRVLIMTIPALKLAIVNIYALNGSEFPWKDPLTGQTKGTRNERKREFNRLLQSELQKMQDLGLQLILIGDWNISREKRDCFPRLRIEEPHSKARKEFNETFMPQLAVVDVFREIHGDKRSYSVRLNPSIANCSEKLTLVLQWFARHKPDRSDAARVDYALISKGLTSQIKRIEYLEDPKWRYQSDHGPLRLDVEVKPSVA